MKILYLFFFYVCLFFPAISLETQAAEQDYFIISESSPAFYLEEKSSGPWHFFPFEQYDLDQEPWVDKQKLEEAHIRFQEFVEIQKQAGYNGIVLGDLGRAITFKKLNLFSPETQEFKKAQIYQDFFKLLIQEHPEIDFFIPADFQISNPKITQYIGKYDSQNSRLKEVNTVALEELFTEIPQIKGVIVRIGEGGNNYSDKNYGSAMIYTDVASIKSLLQNILPVFEKHNKILIFRTWSVGIGKAGNLVNNPSTYEAIFHEFYDSEHLVISNKYGSADFWYFLDDNKVLGTGELPQIVEFQLRREYEGYGLLTNYLSDYYSQIIQRQKQNNNNFKGVYVWPLMGGWDKSNNIPFFTKEGFWIEIDNFLMPDLVLQDKVNIDEKTKNFLKENFTSALVEPIFFFLKDSPQIIKDIYYIENYAQKNLELNNLIAPKIMWIFWDKPISSQFSSIYILKNTDNIQAEIEKTHKGIEKFKQHKKNILENLSNDGSSNEKFLQESLLYQEAFLEILVQYKTSLLSYYSYLENGKKQDYNTALLSVNTLEVQINKFSEQYKDHTIYAELDFSNSYDFISKIKSLPQREVSNIIASFIFFFIACFSFLEWRRRDKPKIKFFILAFLFAVLLMSLSFNSLFEDISVSFIVLSLIFGSILLNFFLYKAFYLKRLIAYKERIILMIISSISVVFFLFNFLLNDFLVERTWIVFYEIFVDRSLKALIVSLIILSLYYVIKVLIRSRQLHLSKNEMLKMFLADLLTFFIMLFLVWHLFLLFFNFINTSFNVFPSIFDKGVGKILLKDLSMFTDINNYFYILYLAAPAFLANMLPVLATKRNWTPFLDKPILTKTFGKNKTWRGFILGTIGATLLTGLFFVIQPIFPFNTISNALLFGFLAGCGALLGDLIESFIKRRIGIKSGKPFIPFDQVDYIIGFVLATSLVFEWLFWDIVFLVLFAMVFNPLTNYLAYLLKIKKTYW